MIFIDNREPDNVASDVISAAHEPTLIRELPWGDFWILPWQEAALLDLPQDLGQLLQVLKVLDLSLDQFLAETKFDLMALAYNLPELLAGWLAGQSLLIESKTPQDFLNSWKQDRLDQQALNMAEHAKASLIVVKGYFYPTPGGQIQIEGRVYNWNYWAVIDKITALSLSGVPVIFVPEKRFPEYLAHLAAWFRKEHALVRPPKPHTLVPLSREANFLCGLPGIGPKLAQSLLEYAHKNPAHALELMTNLETAKRKDRPEDFGPKRIQAVRKFLGLGPHEQLKINEGHDVSIPLQGPLAIAEQEPNTNLGPGPDELGVPF